MEIKKILKTFAIAFFIVVAGAQSAIADAAFPVYPSIRPNVDFWKKVYSEYNSSQGIIHDRNNVSIIYEVIKLNRLGKKNRKKLVSQTKKKYRRILKRLAYNSPLTSEEKLVRDLFGPKPERKVLLKAASNIRFQLGQKDRFRQGVIRSGAYLGEIKRIFNDYDLPIDLVYLPHVESSFNFRAYSKSGAAGMWQFTRGTGKKFMKINLAVDERLDPLRATQAAAKLLKINYEILESWPLALTAYNHGAAGVLRAKKRKGDYESIFNEYQGRRFKFASRNFYSEFLAARDVAKNYTSYFGDLKLDSPVKTRNILMKGYAPADEMAAHFNLRLKELKRLNPALRKSVFTGSRHVPKGYKLHLPYKPKIQGLIASLPPGIFKSAPLKGGTYRVRRGDALSLIASRHGVKLRNLMLANNLSRRSVIYAGQKLIIPGSVKFSAPRTRTSGYAKGGIYRVKRGDALSLIARRHGVKLRNLMLANNLSRRSVIYAGQKLIIPGFEKFPVKSLIYTVRRGDTLWKIASKHGVKTAALLPANNLSRRSVIYPGQKLFIPGVEELAALDKKPRKEIVKPASEKPRNGQIASLPDNLRDMESPKYWPLSSPVDIKTPDKPDKSLKVTRIFEKRGNKYGVIKVAAAETLGHYADWLEVGTNRIRRLNRLSFGRRIKLNDKLIIPLHRVSNDEFETLRHEYRRQMEDDFLNGYKIVKFRLYKMERGDSIWKLCRNDFDLPVWLIKKYNPDLDLGKLKPSQTIIIPVLKKKT